MPERIEPPILLSRVMTFVLAASLVMLLALVLTLYGMFPLNRPQVFFLTSVARNDLEIKVLEFPTNTSELDVYKRMFIREYIKARNEIDTTNIGKLRARWGNDADGVVSKWSTPDVYNEFTQTNMWNAMMNSIPEFEFKCPVEFHEQRARRVSASADVFEIKFRYFCEDNNGQLAKKDYTIHIKLDTEPQGKWIDKLDNPLGLRVSQYKVVSGLGDPLDTGYLETGLESDETTEMEREAQ